MATALTPFLTVFQSRAMKMNSGIFRLPGGDVMVDPALFPEELDAMVVESLRPQCIVLTHSHWDHVLGPRRFPGTPVVAQQLFTPTAEEEREHLARLLAKARVLLPGERFHLPVPEILVGQEMQLGELGSELHLIHTPGHAPDHLSVYHPASATLWAGDILSDVELPYLIHSFTAHEATIARLSTLDVQVLAPGHGSPTDDPAEVRRRFTNERAYLAGLRERVMANLTKGLDAVLAACDGLDAAYPGEEESHRANVESTYLELGGAADGLVGWTRLRRAVENEN